MGLIKINISGIDKIIKYNGRMGARMPYPLFSSFHTIANNINFNDYDKAVIVLRHSNRPANDASAEVELTDLGKHIATIAGNELHNIDKKFTYCSTDTVRTKQTAFYLYEGRDNNLDDQMSTYNDVENMYELGIYGLNYLYDRVKFEKIMEDYEIDYWTVWYRYVYHNEFLDRNCFNDLATESNNFINSAFYHTDNGTIRIVGMHDENLMPFVSYIRKDPRTGEFIINFEKVNKWINYLTGALLLKKNSDNSYIAIPITGQPGGYIFRH